MYLLAFKIFLRNKATYWSIILLLTAGIASLHMGKNFVDRQSKIISKVANIQKEQIQKQVGLHEKEIGLLMFYIKFSVVNTPSMLTAISIGQKDVNPVVTSINIRNLNEQIYNTDLNNPTSLSLGNLDLNFVFIFLFPLVIIVFCYNIISEEKEKGIWSLMKIQSKSIMNTIWIQFSIRILVIHAIFALLIGYALLYLSLPINHQFLSIVILLLIYILFWFIVAFLVVSQGKTSNYNTIVLLIIWIVLTIISPAFLNLWVTKKYNMPEALETVVNQREGYHEKWDMDKKMTMDKFYAHYPQFKNYALPKKEFSWLWYYAMQQMGDNDSQQSAKKMLQKTIEKENFTQTAALFMPSLYTQLQLNQLVQSDLKNHLAYQQAIKAYHEQLKLTFYPLIFEEQSVKQVNWENFKVQNFSQTPNISLIKMLLPLLVFILLMFLLAIFSIRRTIHKL